MGFKQDSGKMRLTLEKNSQGKPGKSLLKISMNPHNIYIVF